MMDEKNYTIDIENLSVRYETCLLYTSIGEIGIFRDREGVLCGDFWESGGMAVP